MPDIDQQKYFFEHFGFLQIALDHLAPFSFYLHRSIRIAITRQIHKIQFLIDVVVIDRLRLTRLCRSPCQRFAVHQPVDQRRFSHITLSGKCNLRECIFR